MATGASIYLPRPFCQNERLRATAERVRGFGKRCPLALQLFRVVCGAIADVNDAIDGGLAASSVRSALARTYFAPRKELRCRLAILP